MNNKLIRTHLTICTISAFLALLIFSGKPSEESNAIWLNLSFPRLVIAFAFLLFCFYLLFLTVYSWFTDNQSNLISNGLNCILINSAHPWRYLLGAVAVCCMTVTLLTCARYSFCNLSANAISIIIRLSPLVAWTGLVAFQFIVIIMAFPRTQTYFYHGVINQLNRIVRGIRVSIKPVGISLLIITLTLVVYRLVWKSIPGFVHSVDHCEYLFCDFTQHYYKQAQQICWSASPVPGYFYSAIFALILSPLGTISQEMAIIYWGIIQVLLMLSLLVIPAIDFYQHQTRLLYLYVLVFSLSFPIIHNFKWGQVSVLLAVLVLGSFKLYSRHRIWSALFLALAVAIKYYCILFLIYFVFRKKLKFLIEFCSLFLFLYFLVPFIFLGVERTIAFNLEALRNAMAPFSASSSQSMPAVVFRLLNISGIEPTWINAHESMVQRALVVVSIVYSFTILCIIYLSLKRSNRTNGLLVGAQLFTLTPFLFGTSWPHYLSYLPFCQCLAMGKAKDEPLRKKRFFQISAVLFSMFLSSVLCFWMSGNYSNYFIYGLPFFANLLIQLCLIGSLYKK